MKTKGQLWSLDFIVSLVIFFFALALLYTFIINAQQENSNELEEMISDVRSIATMIMSEGLPANWTQSSVVIPGLWNGSYTLDPVKWSELDAIHQASQNQYKDVLNTRFNVEVQHQTLNGTVINSLGDAPNNEQNIIQATRFIVANSSITRLQVLLWN